MNRRKFLTGLAVTPAVGMLAASGPTYGFVDVDRWRRLGFMDTHRLLVDGVDVTRRCFAFNDTEGWADCFLLNAGAPYLSETGGPAKQRVWGAVRICR